MAEYSGGHGWLKSQSQETKERYARKRRETYKRNRLLIAKERRVKREKMSSEELQRFRAIHRRLSRKRDLRAFGLTEELYDKMYKEQRGLCAICKHPETALNNLRTQVRRLQVDHNHITGKVRALLCHRCNIGIGLFKESAELLRQAAAYLDKFNS